MSISLKEAISGVTTNLEYFMQDQQSICKTCKGTKILPGTRHGKVKCPICSRNPNMIPEGLRIEIDPKIPCQLCNKKGYLLGIPCL